MGQLPARTVDTMIEAISLSSPSGRMSNRARAAAEKRLSVALFGPEGLQRSGPEQPTERERLLRHAAMLRDLADRGMRTRAFRREADKAEAKAKEMEP
jgi:hypothetical protein